MVAAGIPCSVVATVISVYMPKIIIDRLEFINAFTVAFVIAGIFFVKLLCSLVNSDIEAQSNITI